MKLIFIDLETGGLGTKYPITQMSWIIRVNGREYSKNLFLKAKKEDCDPKALEITGIDLDNPYAVEPEYALKILIQDLEQFIDKDDPLDKFYLVGYNSHAFDCKFLRALFVKYYYTYNKYFWSPSTDVMLIAAGYATGQRHTIGDFKLVTVAQSLGLEVDEDQLHDSMYDVLLTKDIYDILAKEMLN
jgi:DNA polymerase-3 subunit epsilon